MGGAIAETPRDDNCSVFAESKVSPWSGASKPWEEECIRYKGYF